MKKKIFISLSVAFIFILILVLCFTKSTKSFNENYIYNGFTNEFIFDSEDYIFLKNTKSKIISKKDDKEYNFNFDTFSKENLTPMYYDGENIYFFIQDKNLSFFGIGYYDKKFNKHYLIKNEKKDTIKSLLSKNNFLENNKNYLETPTQFIVSGKSVFLYCPGGIFEINTVTHLKKTIFDKRTCETSFSYVNKKLYFCDEEYNLYEYDIALKKLKSIKDFTPLSFCVNEKGILFSDLKNKLSLSFYDFKTKKITIINNSQIASFDMDKNNIYFYIDNKYFKSSFDGKNKKVIKDKIFCDSISKGSDSIFAVFDSNDGIDYKEIKL